MTTVVYELKDVPSIKDDTYKTEGLSTATRLELYLHW